MICGGIGITALCNGWSPACILDEGNAWYAGMKSAAPKKRTDVHEPM